MIRDGITRVLFSGVILTMLATPGWAADGPAAPARDRPAPVRDGTPGKNTVAPPKDTGTAAKDGKPVKDTVAPPKSTITTKSIRDAAVPTPKARPAEAHPPSSLASSPELGGRTIPVPAMSPAATPAAVAAQPLPPPQPTPATIQSGAVEETQPTAPGRDVLPANEAPIGLLARRVKLPPEMDGTAFLVPFDTTTGAAAFRGQDSVYIVFDQRRPIDMRALRTDPAFSSASVRLLPSGTLFRIPLPPERSIALTQLSQGWRIAQIAASPKQQPIAAATAGGRLDLAAEQSSDVVSLADPDTGATLMVGTQRRPGQSIATRRRASEFILRPTIQGVVIEPLADAITLKQTASGFSIAGGGGGLLLSPPTSITEGLMDAALLTRRFTFSTIPPESLLRRSVRQIGDAAAAPPLARGLHHHMVAESLLALGLAAEAESMLHMAAEQDPREAASADTAALTGIAALLAGRPEESAGLTDPRLDGTDEIALWRAIREAMQDAGSPRAATVLAATAPLVFQYPAPMRDHILPLIVETMIEGGEIAPAHRLLDQRKDNPKLAYAQALMKQADGDTDQALTMLDALAAGRDQFDRARAAVRAVELRLASRKLNKTQAADALDKLSYAWRGDARELALQERVAELRAQSGAWRVALTTLRQAELAFPEQAPAIRGKLKDTFTAMIRDLSEARMSPIDFVAMVDENADLMNAASDDEAIQQSLAERLLALDLPDRAETVLNKLMRAAKSDTAKARFGTSLATLLSRDGNDTAVRATLDASNARDMPTELAEKRAILLAGAIARQGDPAAAVSVLLPLHSAPAIEARAQIQEDAANWAGAEQAWTDAAALTLPATGTLNDDQTRTLLRLATATARAGDDAGLAALRAKYTDRLGASPLGDMVRLLTAEPVRTTADIKRSRKEVTLAASLPTELKALRPSTADH